MKIRNLERTVKTMGMVYLLFAFSVFFIHASAGYDSRFQKGRYVLIKNSVLRTILIDRWSFFLKGPRLKKDSAKMSVEAIPFYVAAAVVLITNIVFMLIPQIPIEPWEVETEKFFLFADTLNDKISAFLILLLLFAVFGYLSFSMIRITKTVRARGIKVFVWIVGSAMLLCVALASVLLGMELIFSFV